jgi:hypothetical protein
MHRCPRTQALTVKPSTTYALDWHGSRWGFAPSVSIPLSPTGSSFGVRRLARCSASCGGRGRGTPPSRRTRRRQSGVGRERGRAEAVAADQAAPGVCAGRVARSCVAGRGVRRRGPGAVRARPAPAGRRLWLPEGAETSTREEVPRRAREQLPGGAARRAPDERFRPTGFYLPCSPRQRSVQRPATDGGARPPDR